MVVATPSRPVRGQRASTVNVWNSALGMLGYRVLTASHPDDGLAIGDKHADEIDLVLTDVVMPGTNGPEMAERCPPPSIPPRAPPVGPRAEMLGPLGVSEDGPAIPKKPFTMDTLVERVRGAMGR